MYSTYFRTSKDSLDVINGDHLERCYELLSVSHCYECAFSTEIKNCRNVWFSRDCEDCTHCFGCANLRHKQYYFFNEPLSKEEYESRLEKLNLGSFSAIQKIRERVSAHWQGFPYRFMHGTHNTNVTGDYIDHGKNIAFSFETYDSERVRYSQRIVNGTSDAMDCTSWGDNSQLMYESVVCGENNYNVRFCAFCWPANKDLEYSINCHSSSNLFGCIGMRKKEFCILNKQYDQETFKKMRSKIIAHMQEKPYVDTRGITYGYGEFFPSEISPLSYNESVAIDYFPLTKEQAIASGYQWHDLATREFKTTSKSATLPDAVADVPDSITKEIIACATCGHGYRVLERELILYRHLKLPLPRECHECRYRVRIGLRNPIAWHHRACACAGLASDGGVYANIASHSHGLNRCVNEFETSYAPDRKEIVYCEACYQSEIV
jgi:hypothetical protein